MKKIALVIAVFCVLSFRIYALNPSKTYAATPADFGMDYKEVNIETSDKLMLKGWYFIGNGNPCKTIILSDDGDGNMADMIEIASNFISLGYNVLTYDYRGYGQSPDFQINPRFYIYPQFEKDLNAAIDFILKYHSTCKIIHLYGLGIGAGLSIGVGANRREVSKVIADSPYSTFENIQKTYKEVKGVDVLLPLGYNKVTMEPKYALETKGDNLSGIFFIGGEMNDIYTPKSIKELSKIKSSFSSYYIAKSASMISENFSSDKGAYFDAIKRFLK
jgi:uncharacterized protein